MSNTNDIPVFDNNIDACKFARANGLRVQYLKPSTGEWVTVRNPRFDLSDDNYRIHPDDIEEVSADDNECKDSISASNAFAQLAMLCELLHERRGATRGTLNVQLSLEL